MKIKPIDPILKPLLEEFLKDETYQPKFIAEARKLGYVGDDPDKIRVSLFTPDKDNEICFSSAEIAQDFVDFQIIKQLSLVEPYKTLLELNPGCKPELLSLARDILAGKDVDTDAVLALFPQEEDQELI